MVQTLTFGVGNAKLDKEIATFSLPAGHSCPFAKDCLSKANKLTGKLIDGEHCKFRCFAAMQEATYPTVRKARWNNFNIVTSSNELVNTITAALPKQDIIRVHVAGDYFNEKYFNAWKTVAELNPSRIFYGYTKAIPYLVKYKNELPSNFRFVASFGSTHDELITEHNLISARVVYSIEEANKLQLEIDHDDSHAINYIEPFALLIHGNQPAGSDASKAVSLLRKQGLTGYSKKTKGK